MSKYVDSYKTFDQNWRSFWESAQSRIIADASEHIPDGVSPFCPDPPKHRKGNPYVDFVGRDGVVLTGVVDHIGILYHVMIKANQDSRIHKTSDAAIAFALAGYDVGERYAQYVASRILDKQREEEEREANAAIRKSRRIKSMILRAIPDELSLYLMSWGQDDNTLYAFFKSDGCEAYFYFDPHGRYEKAFVYVGSEYAEYDCIHFDVAVGHFLAATSQV